MISFNTQKSCGFLLFGLLVFALMQRLKHSLQNPKTMIFELALIGGTVLVYQLVQFVLHQKPKPEPKPRDDSVCPKIGDYLPKSSTAKSLPLPDKVRELQHKPITDLSKLYPLNEAPVRLSQPDPALDFEFGWGWDSKNILHIHCNTIFPNATPKMLKFWFINHGNGRGKYHWYKWWHPIDHKRAWWSDDQIHPVHDDRNGYIGHTSYVGTG